MRNLAKSSGIVLALSLSATVIGYLLRLYLARNLSVSDYGLFYAVLVFVGFFATFRDPGLSTALARFIPAFVAKRQIGQIKASVAIVALVQLSIGLLIVVPIFLFADAIAVLYFGTSAAALPLRLISLSFLVSIIMSLLQTVFQGFEKMFYYAVVEPLRLSVVFITTALLIGMGVAGAAYGYLFAPIVVSAVLGFFFIRELPLAGAKIQLDRELAKKILFFGMPLFAGGLGSIAINYADTIVLTFYRPLYEVGLYQAALPTSQLLWFFIGGISSVLLPTISGLWVMGKKEEINNGVKILTKTIFMVIVPLVVVFVVFPESILRILFGESFVPASHSLRILSIGAIFYTFYFMYGMILIAIGRTITYTKLTLATGTAGVVLNLMLVPVFGIVGAASAIMASYALGLLLLAAYAKNEVAINFSISGMVKALLGGTAVAAIIFSIKSLLEIDPMIEIVVAGAISATVYFAFALRFVLNKDDLRILSSIGIKLPRGVNNWLEKMVKQ